MSISSRLSRHLLLASAAAASVVASSDAATTRWNVNVAIPNTSNGLYFNCDNRTYGTNGETTVGWDLQLYQSSTAALAFYGSSSTGTMRAPGFNGYYFGSLAGGTNVAPSGQWAAGLQWDAIFSGGGLMAPGAWMLNSVNYFGVRWLGNDGLYRYGFGAITVGNTASVRTLNYIEWEQLPGVGITVAPAPGAAGLAALAGLGVRRRRR